MAEESTMRQGLTTWLKAECENAGNSMIYAILGADIAQTEALRLTIPNLPPDQTVYIAENVDNLIRSAVSSMTNLPIDLLTAGERQEVFEVKREIEELLKVVRHPDAPGRPELMESLVGKLYGLNLVLRKMLLEKVVECQCGKAERVGEIVMLKVGDRVRILYDEQKDREGAIVDIPYGTNLYKVHLDGDVSPSTWRPYEVGKVSEPEEKYTPPSMKFPEDAIGWEALGNKIKSERYHKYGVHEVTYESEVDDNVHAIKHNLPLSEFGKRWLIAQAGKLDIKEY